MGITFENIFAEAVFVSVFFFDSAEDLLNAFYDLGVPVQIQQRGKEGLDALRNKVFRTTDQLPGVNIVLILGIVHDSFWNQNDISRYQVVHFVFNKIAAVSFGDKIDLEMVMAMLTHCLFVWAHDVYIDIKIEFVGIL